MVVSKRLAPHIRTHQVACLGTAVGGVEQVMNRPREGGQQRLFDTTNRCSEPCAQCATHKSAACSPARRRFHLKNGFKYQWAFGRGKHTVLVCPISQPSVQQLIVACLASSDSGCCQQRVTSTKSSSWTEIDHAFPPR